MDHGHCVAGRWGMACSDNVKLVVFRSDVSLPIEPVMRFSPVFQIFFRQMDSKSQICVDQVIAITESMV